MSDEKSSPQSPHGALPEKLHPILQEWSELIVSLAKLIRENVEGLLPAVFGMASLAQRASEAKIGATATAREAGASLRERATELSNALAPMAEAVKGAGQLRGDLEQLQREAGQLAAQHAGDPALQDFFARLANGSNAALPKVLHLVDSSQRVEAAGLGALDEVKEGLERIERLLHADTAELEAAAARVKHFVESSKEAIDQLILKLQFQDRTDQILQHLLADFESLRSAMAQVGEVGFDVEAWQAERQKRFTTAEERGSGPIASDAGDIELF